MKTMPFRGNEGVAAMRPKGSEAASKRYAVLETFVR